VIQRENREEVKETWGTSQESISNNDTPCVPSISEKLNLDERVKKFLQETTRYISNSSLAFTQKTFSEGSYKGINYYLRRKSVIDLELKKDKILF
jgi:hypothetical protein